MNYRKVLMYVAIAAILFGAITIGILLFRPEKTIFYNVAFQDFDGTVLKIESVEAGKAATAPDDPARDGYTFIGWNKKFSSIVTDTVITAEYLRITDTLFKVDTVTAIDDNNMVEVKVSVTNNPGILGMAFSVNYDEEAFKLIDCRNGVALSALAFQKPSRLISGCNFVWYGSKTGEVVDGEMLILTFQITKNAEPGTYPVSISWNDNAIFDSNSDMVDPDVTQGAIVVN